MKRTQKTPILDDLIARGLVFKKDHDFLGFAADGAVVLVGDDSHMADTERYLERHPSPESW